MVGGYAGTLLWIDLSKNKFFKNPLNLNDARKFIGGKGLGAKILYDKLQAGINPLSPENIFIFITGPLTGTISPMSGKCCVVSKSPLTNTFLDSIVGGGFGPELKFAGYDGIVICGRAQEPTYILIDDDHVELREAGELWGKDTAETVNILKKEIDPTVKIACIGPAGEKLVRFACIDFEHRQAGRGGVGAIMGSKNLKAIAVRGSKGVTAANMNEFKRLSLEAFEKIIKDPHVITNLSTFGTTYVVELMNYFGCLPTKNFQASIFEDAGSIGGSTMLKKIVVKKRACFCCAVNCASYSIVERGSYAGTIVDGPDYETLTMLGSNCGIKNIEVIAYANMLCDKLGMDTISTGNVIGFAMECYEKGIITDKDTQGIDLSFGNEKALIEVIKKIAKREGIGDILAEGVARASKKIGGQSNIFAMHVKGLELAGYSPRGSMSMALAYATSDRGGCHTRCWPIADELKGISDRFSYKGKAESVIPRQNTIAFLNSLIVCEMDWPTVLPLYTKLLVAATGWNYKPDDVQKIGERIYNLTRLFNVREGFTKKDDFLPEREFKEKLPNGPAKGHYIKTADFENMLLEYYTKRGWDEEGKPKKEKLLELRLNEYA